jgi:hypothetical protein
MGKNMDDEYVTLDGYTVRLLTAKAIGVSHSTDTPFADYTWIPRSQVEDGDVIEVGETDICVKAWFAEKEGLSY